jgi:hypothetical protein
LIRSIAAALAAEWSDDETLRLACELAEVNDLRLPRSAMRPTALVQDLLHKGMFKESELQALLADVTTHKPPEECAVSHTFP